MLYYVGSSTAGLPYMRNQNGFTLIELMIVVAILAILAALIIPAVTGGDRAEASVADIPVTYLVCKDSGGGEVRREPSIPGERWEFDDGYYITNDANGNPRAVPANGNECTIE